MIKRNAYKPIFTIKVRMLPSDPTGSLDDYFLENFLLLNKLEEHNG